MKGLDVIGFGALNLDRLFRVNRIAKRGEESFIIDGESACGGSAANTIVGLARLGCQVGFIGKVGGDKEGEMLLANFREEGVNLHGIPIEREEQSGSVMGFVDEEGERALYINAGVNDLIVFEEVDLEYAFQTRFLHFTSFVGKTSFEAQKQLLAIVPDNVRISFDPGLLYAKKGLVKLEPILEKTQVLLINSYELEMLTGEIDYRRGADFLVGKGVEIVAVKLGNKGCYITDGVERLKVVPFNVKVVDTTGAGDAFNAGFIYGLLREKCLYECGRLGNFVASKSVKKMGARSGLPYLKDLSSLG